MAVVVRGAGSRHGGRIAARGRSKIVNLTAPLPGCLRRPESGPPPKTAGNLAKARV
jgi:hypothetical protein